MTPTTYTFTFTAEQTQYLINTLMTRPYAEVRQLIDQLVASAQEQQQPKKEDANGKSA